MTPHWPDPADVGRRVVVRFRTGGTAMSGRPELSDAVGHVREITSDTVVVERRNGDLVTIRRADTVTWKPVPDQPAKGA